jgi:uncharacterized protein (DUF58 family)
MLPSPRLIVLVAAVAPIFLAGAFFDPFAAAGVIYLLALCAAMALDLVLLPRRRRVAVERMAPERLSLAVPERIAITVRNRGRRSLQVRLRQLLPPGMEAQPAECAGTLAGGAEGTFEVRLTARQRGRYQLGPVDVRLLPALGLFYRQFQLALPAEVHVFPNVADVKRYDLLLRRGLTHEEGLARLRQLGQGWQFESLRPFAEGDDLSRVDWKATARRAEMIVRSYEVEREQNVTVAIDVGRATAGEFAGISRLDYLVNATLMLAYVVLRQHDWFSLVAFSDRIESYLPPVRRLQNLERVARALYALEPRLVEADYGAACRFLDLKNRKRGLICLMTDVVDREASATIISYMAHYARRHLPLAITLADTQVRAAARAPLAEEADPYAKAAALDVLAAREEALRAMRRMGVGVLDVEPTRLTPELINRYLLIKATHRL